MFLKLLQLIFLILPLPAALIAFVVAERFAWTVFIAPFVAILSSYAAVAYLLVFGREGSWQMQLATWLRHRVLQRPRALLGLIFLLSALIFAQAGLLVRGPLIELSGVVLVDNRPISGKARIVVLGFTDIWQSDAKGGFQFTIADQRQTEITLIAEFGNLTGKKIVRRGGHRGFDISLDKRIVLPPRGDGSKSIALVGKAKIVSSAPSDRAVFQLRPADRPLIVFEAAGQGQEAYELSDVRHGALTFYLLEALRSRNLTDIGAISTFIMNGVSDATKGRQHPIVYRKGGIQSFPLLNGSFHTPNKFFAVVIGLSEYMDPWFQRPAFATRDAVAVYSWLLEAGAFPANVHLLLNAQATKTNVIKYLEEVSGAITQDSFVLIYYSGVGAVEEDLDGDEIDSLDEYFTCFDSHAGFLYNTAISDDWINVLLYAMAKKASKCILVFDSSFAVPSPR